MKTVPVPPPRARIEDLGGGLRVLLPSRRNLPVMVFLTVWLVAWLAAGASVIQQLPRSGNQPFQLVWLAMWASATCFSVALLAWMALGREILELGSDVLVHRRLVLGAGVTRAYDLAAVKQLRVGPAIPSFRDLMTTTRPNLARALEVWGFSGGPIVFDYGARTLRCGASIDEAEARQIVERLGQRDARLRAVSP